VVRSAWFAQGLTTPKHARETNGFMRCPPGETHETNGFTRCPPAETRETDCFMRDLVELMHETDGFTRCPPGETHETSCFMNELRDRVHVIGLPVHRRAGHHRGRCSLPNSTAGRSARLAGPDDELPALDDHRRVQTRRELARPHRREGSSMVASGQRCSGIRGTAPRVRLEVLRGAVSRVAHVMQPKSGALTLTRGERPCSKHSRGGRRRSIIWMLGGPTPTFAIHYVAEYARDTR
jgi:hypothetical protein